MIRRALSDSQVLVYLGFAEGETAESSRAASPSCARSATRPSAQLAALTAREALGRGACRRPRPPTRTPGARSARAVDAVEVEELDMQIAQARASLAQLEKQIAARTNALPLFKATIGTESLADELRARRDHPMHKLLRRMYFESRTPGA